jgi:uncharacterized protein (TIGR02996 family)
MSDGDTLYRSILAAPADDAPRLVYADWLEEHGDLERAELIRQMVHFPRDRTRYRPPEPGSNYWPNAPNWLGYVVRRGFVAEIEVSTPLFLTHAADLFARHPITLVQLTGRSVVLDRPMVFRAVLAPGAHLETSLLWPAELFPDLPHGTELVFSHERQAFRALSDAAVAFGRRAARLPPLI